MANIRRVIGLWLTLISFGLVLLALALGSMLPESDQLAYVSAVDGDLDIYLRDMGRGLIFNLTDTPENETQPEWSPDGSQIVMVSVRDSDIDLYLLQVYCPGFFSTCNIPNRRLTSDFGGQLDPSWSPDGTYIAYTSDETGDTEIMLIDVKSGEVHALTDNQNVDINPSWSPDGSQIVFISDRDAPWIGDIYLMNADGSNIRALHQTPDSEFSPSWSPDGRRLLYGIVAMRGQLFILDLESETVTPLLDENGYDDSPAWSRDGQTLALSSARSGDYELYVLRLDCEGLSVECLQRLTFNPALDTMPAWRP